MGRDLPVECGTCGEIVDWGDFGPEDGSQCRCRTVRVLDDAGEYARFDRAKTRTENRNES